jgi:signal transduction protein with GAF and PtsI domain
MIVDVRRKGISNNYPVAKNMFFCGTGTGEPSRRPLEFCNNVLDECVTILLEDRADKSSTIYFINEQQELEMFAYNRIEFSSSRGRKFKKGEGFAGHIWDSGETELVLDVNNSPYFEGEYAPQHEYGSILGVPIRIGKEIVGVLCVQSENVEEFQDDDKRTVIFYADICALAGLLL